MEGWCDLSQRISQKRLVMNQFGDSCSRDSQSHSPSLPAPVLFCLVEAEAISKQLWELICKYLSSLASEVSELHHLLELPREVQSQLATVVATFITHLLLNAITSLPYSHTPAVSCRRTTFPKHHLSLSLCLSVGFWKNPNRGRGGAIWGRLTSIRKGRSNWGRNPFLM